MKPFQFNIFKLVFISKNFNLFGRILIFEFKEIIMFFKLFKKILLLTFSIILTNYINKIDICYLIQN
jgi:hypothetical protein